MDLELRTLQEELGALGPFLDLVDGLRVVLKDLSHRYVYVSEGWLESTGLEDVIGKTVFDVFPAWRAERYYQEERWRDGQVIGMVIIGFLIDPEMVRKRLLDTKPEAIDWVERQLRENLTMAEVAEHLGMSRRTLERYFQRKTGMSPSEYRKQCRIARARKLLQYSSRSLAEIAGECGFCDQSHFTRIFREEMKESPGAWRRRSVV